MLNLLRRWLRPAAAFETGAVLLAGVGWGGLVLAPPVPASFVTLGLMAVVMASAAACSKVGTSGFWLVPVGVHCRSVWGGAFP
jgi:hypothetical protein